MIFIKYGTKNSDGPTETDGEGESDDRPSEEKTELELHLPPELVDLF